MLSLQSSQNIWQSWSRALASGENLSGETEAQGYWDTLYTLGWCQCWEEILGPPTLVVNDSQLFLRVYSMACFQMESS